MGLVAEQHWEATRSAGKRWRALGSAEGALGSAGERWRAGGALGERWDALEERWGSAGARWEALGEPWGALRERWGALGCTRSSLKYSKGSTRTAGVRKSIASEAPEHQKIAEMLHWLQFSDLDHKP